MIVTIINGIVVEAETLIAAHVEEIKVVKYKPPFKRKKLK